MSSSNSRCSRVCSCRSARCSRAIVMVSPSAAKAGAAAPKASGTTTTWPADRPLMDSRTDSTNRCVSLARGRRRRKTGDPGCTPARVSGLVGLLAMALAACSPPRALEAARVLTDIAAGSGPSALKENTPEPSRTPISNPGAAPLGDLYWPGEDAAAALVLVPGAVKDGKDDPRMVAFANTFARARFAVLVPEIPNLRTRQLSPEDA